MKCCITVVPTHVEGAEPDERMCLTPNNLTEPIPQKDHFTSIILGRNLPHNYIAKKIRFVKTSNAIQGKGFLQAFGITFLIFLLCSQLFKEMCRKKYIFIQI
jgi:hypothetical protein